MPKAQTVEELKLKPNVPAHCIRFRQGRKAAAITLSELCRRLSISEQAILQFETGKQRLDLERFALACQHLNLDARWVLYGLGEMFEGPPPLLARPTNKAKRKRLKAKAPAMIQRLLALYSY